MINVDGFINCRTPLIRSLYEKRVLNAWNALPDSVDFTSLNKFKQNIYIAN